jgi:hypothetical protein
VCLVTWESDLVETAKGEAACLGFRTSLKGEPEKILKGRKITPLQTKAGAKSSYVADYKGQVRGIPCFGEKSVDLFDCKGIGFFPKAQDGLVSRPTRRQESECMTIGKIAISYPRLALAYRTLPAFTVGRK